VLLEHLSMLVRAEERMGLAPETWEKERPEGKLKVTFSRLPVEGRLLWVLRLEEVPRELLSIWRRRLTRAEAQILDSVLLGYSNADIAADRQRAVRTVKKQLTSIYKKLGVDGRHDLISRALRP
jgi:DNA-binding CsgD family transcriptional regulator